MPSAIVQAPNAVLRNVAELVPDKAIKSAKIKNLLEQMNKVLDDEDDGVALAAPQIGESLRIFVVSKRASKKLPANMAFINPEIIRLGKKKISVSEGCLSVRWKYGLVKRSETASVRAQNSEGNTFVMSGRGLLAQIFQHEIDHLNGILFIDKATDIEDLPPKPNE